ncbi:MAG TPA: Lrp/AsnC family transcriptional regulator [Acidimicrobiales bacterium]|nr:Lrp/AsnC family transcriptional regulator [Acidimicrobiales bacterium]
MTTMELDDLDRRLLLALGARPRAGMLELSRSLGVARNTAQARLDRLTAAGVVTGFGPDLDLAALGYQVTAFTTLEISQGRSGDVLEHLRSIPEVAEVHRTTGAGDLLCRIVATSNDHLALLLDRILEVHGIARTTTAIALDTPLPSRSLQLLAAQTADAAATG